MELVTVNEVEYVLPLVSDIFTKCVPTVAVLGTVRDAMNSPSELLLIALGLVATAIPSNDIVIPELAAKPLP